MDHVLIKIYTALHPAGEGCIEAVQRAGADALNNGEPWLFREGNSLRISFEGLYFPEDAVLEALERTLPPAAEGKMDVIDLEAWELRRYQRREGRFERFARGLNEVLEYAERKGS